jgi:hypothetical protein
VSKAWVLGAEWRGVTSRFSSDVRWAQEQGAAGVPGDASGGNGWGRNGRAGACPPLHAPARCALMRTRGAAAKKNVLTASYRPGYDGI